MTDRQAPPLALETNAGTGQLEARHTLRTLFETSPLPPDELLGNLALYTRGSLLVKTLVLNDLYQRILDVPGVIMEFGVWWGQSLVLFENLRAIYEPFNKTRQIVGFDTFAGYAGVSPHDGRETQIFQEGQYATSAGYEEHLAKLLAAHECCNVLGHIANRHRLIKGDVRSTAQKFFVDHPATVVALAFFDMGLYEPTKAALEAILPHTLPGSVIVLDEFTWDESPGEALAFKELFSGRRFQIVKSRLTPMRAIITLA